MLVFFFFFFKQKTAYEIVPCDWSSDVCSSDLGRRRGGDCAGGAERRRMVWTARRVAARGRAEQALGVVVRSGGHQAGQGNKGDHDSATLTVFRTDRKNSGNATGVLVGGAARRRFHWRKISRHRIRGLLPVCERKIDRGGRIGL